MGVGDAIYDRRTKSGLRDNLDRFSKKVLLDAAVNDMGLGNAYGKEIFDLSKKDLIGVIKSYMSYNKGGMVDYRKKGLFKWKCLTKNGFKRNLVKEQSLT